MKILIVDDSGVARVVMRRILASIGYEDVLEARDGMEGIQLLSRESVDLVLCDWKMPNLDGLTFVRAVRKSPQSDVPVLMVSSESYVSKIVEIINAGANGYVRKPFRAGALRKKIAEIRKKAEMANRSSEVFSGSLTEVGFPELVQFLSTGQRTGQLELKLRGGTGHVGQRLHVVQAIGELDEYHADILDHRQHHLTKAFCLRLCPTVKFDLIELADTINQ